MSDQCDKDHLVGHFTEESNNDDCDSNDNEIILIILSGIASLGRAGDWICFLSIADHRVQGRHLVLKGTGGDKMEDVYACCVSLLL